jgi:hypothetical protein
MHVVSLTGNAVSGICREAALSRWSLPVMPEPEKT